MLTKLVVRVEDASCILKMLDTYTIHDTITGDIQTALSIKQFRNLNHPQILAGVSRYAYVKRNAFTAELVRFTKLGTLIFLNSQLIAAH